MTKNNRQFQEFLRDEVNINDSRLERLHRGVRAVRNHLKDNLPGYQKTEPQGSLALGTIIKPVDDNDEYDADIQVVMNPNPNWKPKDYVNAVHRTLKKNNNYADKLRLKTRCVTIDYAGDFHLDVVPRVTIRGKHYVCNRVENRFEVTDGNGYRDWFNEKNQITGGNLKRVVRILKYLRDHKNNYTVKSIMLTTLAGNMIKPSDEGTEAVSTVADTLVTVLTRMDTYLQKNPRVPEIKNPVLPSENFNRHWDQKKYANFRKRVHSHALTARKARSESSSDKGIKLWQELFGKSFGKSSSGGGGNGGSNSSSSGRGKNTGRRAASASSIPGGCASPRGEKVRLEGMTDEHFHLESLEEFREELANTGFQRVPESSLERWTGRAHPALAPLTDATSMDIVIAPGWPFQPPAVFVDGVNTNHSTPNGLVCMWREGDFNPEWTTLGGLFSRLEQWCENAVNGWEDDHLDQDALLNFPAKKGDCRHIRSVCARYLQ